MIALTVDKADGFVARLQRKGVKVRWDGWDMVFFKTAPEALRSPRGKRLGNEWGYESRVSPNHQGKWLVSYRLSRGD